MFLIFFFFFFSLMENLGAMAYSRYTGFREITDRDVLELYCIENIYSFAVNMNVFIEFYENISIFTRTLMKI